MYKVYSYKMGRSSFNARGKRVDTLVGEYETLAEARAAHQANPASTFIQYPKPEPAGEKYRDDYCPDSLDEQLPKLEWEPIYSNPNGYAAAAERARSVGDFAAAARLEYSGSGACIGHGRASRHVERAEIDRERAEELGQDVSNRFALATDYARFNLINRR